MKDTKTVGDLINRNVPHGYRAKKIWQQLQQNPYFLVGENRAAAISFIAEDK